MNFIEQGCCIEHQGRKFCAGGAVVTSEHIIAYPKENGVLGDWNGNAIGTWRSVANWRVNSYMGIYLHQIEAVVGKVRYTGRGFGIGCIYRGRRKK